MRVEKLNLRRYTSLFLSIILVVLLVRIAQFSGFNFVVEKSKIFAFARELQYLRLFMMFILLAAFIYYYNLFKDVLKEFFKQYIGSSVKKGRWLGYFGFLFFIIVLILDFFNYSYWWVETNSMEEGGNITFSSSSNFTLVSVEIENVNKTLETEPLDFSRSSWVDSLTMILLFLVVLAASFIEFKAFREAYGEIVEEEEVEEVASVIEKALEDLRTSVECEDVIVKCFLELREIVLKRGLRLKESMTVREVFNSIRRMFPGVPNPPLYKLVNVFEKAVYSGHPVSELEKEIAIESLEELKMFFSGVAK